MREMEGKGDLSKVLVISIPMRSLDTLVRRAAWMD